MLRLAAAMLLLVAALALIQSGADATHERRPTPTVNPDARMCLIPEGCHGRHPGPNH